MSRRLRHSDSRYTHLIGIDGCEYVTAAPTEKMPQELIDFIAGKGMEVCDVRYHQHLLHPHIPNHGRNRSLSLSVICHSRDSIEYSDIESAWEVAPELQLESLCLKYLRPFSETNSASVGLCVASIEQLEQERQELVSYAIRTTEQLIYREEALRLSLRANILLREIEGKGAGSGIIGALAAVVFHHFKR